jgi:hypothetical protein
MKKSMMLVVVSAMFLLIAGYGEAGTKIMFDAPGASDTYAYGIDGDNIVGFYYDDSGSHGFLYDGINWTTIDVPGAGATYVTGIDGDNIVGYDSLGHGFLFDGTNFTTLDMPGAESTYIFGIDGDNIVGFYEDGSHRHGFLYDGADWTTLDAFGGYGTTIFGIDGDNIVGTSSGWATQTWLYDGENWAPIHTLGGVPSDISGDKIVGYYPGSGASSYVYTIPEPATMVLFGLGGLVLRRRRT